MKTNLKYRGQLANEKSAATIRKIIAENTDACKRFISQEVCSARRWTQTNSALTNMICQILFILMESIGPIKQPQPKSIATNPPAHRKNPTGLILTNPPLNVTSKEPLSIQQVQIRKTRQDKLYNGIVDGRHYLGMHPTRWRVFLATCYIADNRIHAGHTTGPGKLSNSYKPNRLKKGSTYIH